MPSQFDITQTAAAIYAESFIQLANEAGEAEEIGTELRDLKQMWQDDPDFASLMSSVAIDLAARGKTLRNAFGNGRVSQLTLNLLLVLNDKRRSMILPDVCDAYRHKLDRQLGREEVHVTSATPLEDEQRARLREEIQRITGREPDFVERVDPDLLGGVTVQVADQVYDMSVLRRLRDIRIALKQAAEKHLLTDISRFVTEG